MLAATEMEQVCPRCKTSSYHNPSMKLMVNICGHRLCDACVDSVFSKPSAPCPECGLALRRNQFRQQQFEDSSVEKEVDIRKKILKDYNKAESDFPTLRDYNDYLEEIETIVFNLTNGIEVEETKEKLETYRKENQALILKNRVRQQREEQALKDELEREQLESELRSKRAFAEIEEADRERKRQKQSIISELMTSDSPASEVLAKVAAATKVPPAPEAPKTTGPTYHAQKAQTVFNPLPQLKEGDAYVYHPLFFESYGPLVPDLDELQHYGYLAHVRMLDASQLGGGFSSAYACQRQLQDAFSCLLYFPNDP